MLSKLRGRQEVRTRICLFVGFEARLEFVRGYCRWVHGSLSQVLIVLVVDVLDIPGSIHKTLPEIIGKGKPVIVVGEEVPS